MSRCPYDLASKSVLDSEGMSVRYEIAMHARQHEKLSQQRAVALAGVIRPDRASGDISIDTTGVAAAASFARVARPPTARARLEGVDNAGVDGPHSSAGGFPHSLGQDDTEPGDRLRPFQLRCGAREHSDQLRFRLRVLFEPLRRDLVQIVDCGHYERWNRRGAAVVNVMSKRQRKSRLLIAESRWETASKKSRFFSNFARPSSVMV